MTARPILTEATIRGLATPESFSRGEEYYHAGQVVSIERRGDMLRAEVAGSSYEPYQVAIKLDESGIAAADCSCPYDWGGYCKHIVATLLTYIRKQEKIPERQTPDALLTGLDAKSLRDLLCDLLNLHAELIPWVETQIILRAAPAPPAAATSPRPTAKPQRPPIDTNAIRRQVRYQMRVSDDYYAAGTAVSGLDSILAQARQALDANDGENALAIVGVIAEETIPSWEEFDDSDGEFGDWFSELGAVFAEALLTADLSPQERKEWVAKLERWQAELDDYGVEDAFDAALCAAEHGWDYTPLRRAMEGRAPSAVESTNEESWFIETLTDAWLNVLERQGRTDEFLNLARHQGCIARYVTMLVKAGRMAEAIDYGLSQSLAPNNALALAKALREHGEHQPALRVAEGSLAQGGHEVHGLAVWLRDAATAAGEMSLALRAARVAFDASLSLADYQAVQVSAGDDWPGIRRELLQRVKGSPDAWSAIDIFLHEGLIDDAIRALDSQPYAGYSEVEKVVDAAWQTHPDWAIRQCQRQAEPIMNEGKSKYYSHALGWLEKARKAYLAAGRGDEWRAYCEGLIARHGRKYSLVPGLKALLKGR